MNKRQIRDELLKARTELGTSIDLLVPLSVRQTKAKLRTTHRRIGRAMNALKPRSSQGTGKTPLAQVPPVSAPVSGLLAHVSGSSVDWIRLLSEIKKKRHSYGEIARAIGKGTGARAAVHLVVNGKTKSGPVFNLVASWAIQRGYRLSTKSTRATKR